MIKPPQDQLLTVAQAVEERAEAGIPLDARTIRRAVERRQIIGRKYYGSLLLVDRASVMAYVSQYRGRPKGAKDRKPRRPGGGRPPGAKTRNNHARVK